MIRLAGLVRTSTIDWPGFLSAVIFTPGCNFDCFYCQNRSLLGAAAPQIDYDEVMAFLQKRRGLIEGIVVTGGEPLLQTDLPSFLQTVRALGYRIKLDTNGSRPLMLQKLIRAGLVDYVAIDLKAPWSRYPEISGCRPSDTEAVRGSFSLLAQSSVDWEARTTVPPQLAEEDLAVMARSVEPLPAWFLQHYRLPQNYKPQDRFRVEAPGFTPGDLLRLAETVRPWQPAVAVRA